MARKPKPPERRTRGTGSVYKTRKLGDTWSLKWREGGQIRYRHGLTEELARKALIAIQGELAQGRSGLAGDDKSAPSLNHHATKWLEARTLTHKSVYEDQNRWQNHFQDTMGRLRPNQVDVEVLKKFITSRRKAGLSTTTVKLLIALLSSLFTDLVEAKHAVTNPCKNLSSKTRKLIKPQHDTKLTPFLGSLADVQRVLEALKPLPSIRTAYAVGALAGLRTSEIRALRWEHVDLGTGNIHVQVQVERRRGKDPSTWNEDGVQSLKSDETRIVPVFPMLAAILGEIPPGERQGLVCRPIRHRDGGHLSDRTMSSELRKVLTTLKLARPGLGWYECSRHTMASLYILDGGTLEDLKRILGHSTVLVTERYAH
ncbi:MAG: tyrosine-type recombinase/integrase, partial [Myxococcales bacterium]